MTIRASWLWRKNWSTAERDREGSAVFIQIFKLYLAPFLNLTVFFKQDLQIKSGFKANFFSLDFKQRSNPSSMRKSLLFLPFPIWTTTTHYATEGTQHSYHRCSWSAKSNQENSCLLRNSTCMNGKVLLRCKRSLTKSTYNSTVDLWSAALLAL